MNAELLNRAPAEVVARNAANAAQRRNAEANDAMDFVFLGDEEGRHAEKCLHAQAGRVACCRDYDPRPYPEAEPVDLRMYEGTGIGALYGLGETVTTVVYDEDGAGVASTRSLVTELAGWNLVRDGSL